MTTAIQPAAAPRAHDSIPRPNAARFLALSPEERRRRLSETRKALGSFLPSSDEYRALARGGHP